MRSPAPLLACIAAAFALVLACAPDAEARGRRGGRVVFGGGGGSASAEPSQTSAITAAATASGARPIMPVQAPVTREASSKTALCARQRVGSGAGFCEIN